MVAVIPEEIVITFMSFDVIGNGCWHCNAAMAAEWVSTEWMTR